MRLPEALDELRGPVRNVVEVTFEPKTGPPGNACRQHASQAGPPPAFPTAKDPTSVLVHKPHQPLTASANSHGAPRWLLAADLNWASRLHKRTLAKLLRGFTAQRGLIRQSRQMSVRHSGIALTAVRDRKTFPDPENEAAATAIAIAPDDLASSSGKFDHCRRFVKPALPTSPTKETLRSQASSKINETYRLSKSTMINPWSSSAAEPAAA